MTISWGHQARLFGTMWILVLFVALVHAPTLHAACFASNKASFSAQSVPNRLAPGERRCGIQVRMRNVGNQSPEGELCATQWKAGYGYRLGAQNVENNLIWGINRVSVDTAASPEGNAEQVFNFCITAPTTPGVYNFQWRMVQEGNLRNCFACGGCETIPGSAPEWFGEFTPNVAIRVSADPNDAKTRYLTLGDSYAAGVGLAPYVNNTPGAGAGKCERSQDAYANKVLWPPGSAESQMVRRFYACSGATTQTLISATAFGEPAQLSYESDIRAADLVSVSIGGNNMGFSNLVGQCSLDQIRRAGMDLWNSSPAGFLVNGTFEPPSWSSFDPRSCVFKPIYDQTYQALRRLNAPDSSTYGIAGALSKLRSLMKRGPSGSPAATGVVVGYPHVVPSGEGPGGSERQHCPSLQFANLDPCEQNFVRDGVEQLNKILKREAMNQGFLFLDLAAAFNADGGHNLCEAGEPWVQGPFIPTSLGQLTSLMHPTRDGHTAIARAMENLLAAGAAQNARTPAGMPQFRKRRGGDFGGWVESLWHALPVVSGNLNWCENSIVTGTRPALSSDSALLAEDGAKNDTTISSGTPADAAVGRSGFRGKALVREGIHDGYSDIVWRNATTGDNAIWYMEGSTAVGSATLPRIADSATWVIAGNADFDRDGQEDLFWRNTVTGANVVWLMRGATAIGSANLPSAAAEWRVGAVADFNGDEKPDIVWRNANGANAIWVMNGMTAVSVVALPSIADPQWQMLGAGDFNGDGATDLLWRNPQSTGDSMSLWLMDGTATKAGINFPADITPDYAWSFGAILDVDGDDNLDLVFRHATRGEVGAMMLNQTQFKSFTRLFTLADAHWQIVGPR